jgi:hypothetical protein
MTPQDEHANHAAQAFGQCLDAFLSDAHTTGMADGNHHDDAHDTRIAIGPMDV